MLRTIFYNLLLLLGRVLSNVLIRLTITGRENLPDTGPLIIISNHFSWFEAPLLGIHLPYLLTFFMAAELPEQSVWLKLIVYAVDVIPVQRGRVDRSALRQASQVLDQQGFLIIFPEGGIDPDLSEAVANGRPIPMSEGQNTRLSAQLIPARSGTAYLAAASGAKLLPVTFLGTERIQENLRKFKRTPVEMCIGQPFGPLTLEPGLRGRDRRARLDELGDQMMQRLADLLPPANRGPYA